MNKKKAVSVVCAVAIALSVLLALSSAFAASSPATSTNQNVNIAPSISKTKKNVEKNSVTVLKIFDPLIYVNQTRKAYTELFDYVARVDLAWYFDSSKDKSGRTEKELLDYYDKNTPDASGYFDSIDYVMTAAAVSYQQSSDAFKLKNDKYTDEFGFEVSINSNDHTYKYEVIGENTYGNDPTKHVIGEYTSYDAKNGKVVTECYFLDKNNNKGRFISYIEAVSYGGKLFMQKVEWLKDASEKNSTKPYYAYRVMIDDKDVYFSGKLVSEKDMKALRIKDSYKGFAEFAIEKSDVIKFTGAEISLEMNNKPKYSILPIDEITKRAEIVKKNRASNAASKESK